MIFIVIGLVGAALVGLFAYIVYKKFQEGGDGGGVPSTSISEDLMPFDEEMEEMEENMGAGGIIQPRIPPIVPILKKVLEEEKKLVKNILKKPIVKKIIEEKKELVKKIQKDKEIAEKIAKQLFAKSKVVIKTPKKVLSTVSKTIIKKKKAIKKAIIVKREQFVAVVNKIPVPPLPPKVKKTVKKVEKVFKKIFRRRRWGRWGR